MGFATSTRHRPLLVAAAVGDALGVVVLVGLAVWCWHRGVSVTVHRGAELSRIEGRWWAAATGAVTLAGILLLNAGRKAIHARRAWRG